MKNWPLAYRLELPLNLSNIHDVFHVSQLQKHIPDPTHKIRVETIKLRDNLTYLESLNESWTVVIKS